MLTSFNSYFDVTWEGPVMQNGKPTSTVKSKSSIYPNSSDSIKPKLLAASMAVSGPRNRPLHRQPVFSRYLSC